MISCFNDHQNDQRPLYSFSLERRDQLTCGIRIWEWNELRF
jgi:hypothetical protein